jgi:hypothetical protein
MMISAKPRKSRVTSLCLWQKPRAEVSRLGVSCCDAPCRAADLARPCCVLLRLHRRYALCVSHPLRLLGARALDSLDHHSLQLMLAIAGRKPTLPHLVEASGEPSAVPLFYSTLCTLLLYICHPLAFLVLHPLHTSALLSVPSSALSGVPSGALSGVLSCTL